MGVELAGKNNGNEIAMALWGYRSAIGQFGAKICAPIPRSLHVDTISVMLRRKREKELVLLSVRPHVSGYFAWQRSWQHAGSDELARKS